MEHSYGWSDTMAHPICVNCGLTPEGVEHFGSEECNKAYEALGLSFLEVEAQMAQIVREAKE